MKNWKLNSWRKYPVKHIPEYPDKKELDQVLNKIKKYKMDDIIAIDETSISIGLHIKNGYEYIGKRLDKITTDNKVFVK